MIFYADGDKKQILRQHIEGVSKKASTFSSGFRCAEWGALLGVWHDLGKYSDAFQQYMLAGKPQVEHAVVGGRYATDVFDDFLRRLVIQFVITCHHTGLQNQENVRQRLRKAARLMDDAIKNVPEDLLQRQLPDWPEWLSLPGKPFSKQEKEEWQRSLGFWIRILHSCLVDADWLDAEKRNIDAPKRPLFPSIRKLRDKLDSHIDKKVSDAQEQNWTKINIQRKMVLDACRNAADTKPGYFSLTAPTGGGKTLSAMSFALNHAVTNSLRRVIVVIPFTSIIEQNAEVYSSAIGKENVIEHHSSLDLENETERNRLASENWDAPIIVTTNVQFFESLFGNRNSKIRKLHNVARSVIVFDEVQSLPPRLLYPILDVMHELKNNYGCSLVFCTATQPALNKRKSLRIGLENVREIIPDRIKLARDLARVKVEWQKEQTDYEKIAEHINQKQMKRVLIITHKRKDARELAQMMPEGTYHLSALMCAAHRREVLSEVKEKLNNKSATVRLVSTQLVEAGVDIDFPVVFRALGGIDSIAQAAGRCNREGSLDEGRLIVFHAPTDPPKGVLRMGKDITESLLNLCSEDQIPTNSDGTLDFTHPDLFQTYFRLFYANSQLDSAGVQTARASFDFAEVAKRFRMIEDAETYPLVVPCSDAYENKVNTLRDKHLLNRDDFRALQPFIVQLYTHNFNRLNEAGALEFIHESFYCLTEPYKRLYDKRFGLVVDEDNLFADPSGFIFDK